MEKYDILAFWAHPDDVECGAWATLAKLSKEWKKILIVDLTTSQLSTRWTPETRISESLKAAKILWAERENLWLSDGQICTETCQKQIIWVIRKYQPDIIFWPYYEDFHHPDHENLGKALSKTLFFSGLAKYENEFLPHRPKLLLHYRLWSDFEPDITIGFDEQQYQKKMMALDAYESQKETNNKFFRRFWHSREIVSGFHINRDYWEIFKLYGWNIGVENLEWLFTARY